MTAYYNENDPKAAAWLRELIKGGHIAPGVVDERSIEDVLPNELTQYTQCHFFAGIGGWSHGLRLAGWPDDMPAWTGSCPCQPFSAAGKGAGFADERHLWPAWFHLISECRPQRIFGEQVANALGWFDLVQRDLEGEGYSSGAAIVGAHSVGAPHIRQRLYWGAHGDGSRRKPGRSSEAGDGRDSARLKPSGLRIVGALENPELPSRTRFGQYGRQGLFKQEAEGLAGSGSVGSWWRNADWIYCADQKYRPVEPGTSPLAHGIPGRVGLLRGYGNAIVPQVAAAFIESYLSIE